jgi:FAD/FMN-containing dehydrogenase
LFRLRINSNKTKINIRDFNKVISIDKKNLTADVEGMIPYNDLIKETLKHDLLPTVVPQLMMITVGGAISGIGIESSSFKFGLVHETVLEMDILTGNGKILNCSKEKNSDLFYSIPNSYGTLGYVLRAKIKLIKTKKYVLLNHYKYTNSITFFKDLKAFCNNLENDYIDGTVFNNNEMYITIGKFVDYAQYTSNYKYMKMYYKSITKIKTDYLKTIDYIERWDSDWFWCSKAFYMNNLFLRFLLGKFILNSKSYLKIKKLNEKYKLTKKINNFLKIFKKNDIKKEAVIQDVAIPIENCNKFLEFFNKEIKIKPVWICPVKAYNSEDIYPLFKTDPKIFYVDFGFWDFVPTYKGTGYYNKKIEQIVKKLDGKKSLYSESFYNKKDFFNEYNGKHYFKIKKKYDKNNIFLDLYEKCVLKK